MRQYFTGAAFALAVSSFHANSVAQELETEGQADVNIDAQGEADSPEVGNDTPLDNPTLDADGRVDADAELRGEVDLQENATDRSTADRARHSQSDRNARWRFKRHNGEWWYWMPEGYWMYQRDGSWLRYDANTFVRPSDYYRMEGRYGSGFRGNLGGRYYYGRDDYRYDYGRDYIDGRDYYDGRGNRYFYEDGRRYYYNDPRYYWNDGRRFYDSRGYDPRYRDPGFRRGANLGEAIGGAVGGDAGAAIGAEIGGQIGED